MAKKYCIYSNEYIEEYLLNKEHIIPKKLGGHLDTSLFVAKELNSRLGSEVDSLFVEDAFVKLHSKEFDFKGHSKKITPTLKNSVIKETNEKVDISFVNNEMIFHKKWEKDSPSWIKTLKECRAQEISCSMVIDLNIYLRFFAKILLASGYFLYGDTFVKYGFHEDLRLIMNTEKAVDFVLNNDLNTHILSSDKNPDFFMHIVTSDLNAFKNYHIIWSSFYQNAVVIGVSLFGNKILSANCMVSKEPDKFSVIGKGDVLLKELSTNSQRRLIKTTQEEVVTKFAKTFFPDVEF